MPDAPRRSSLADELAMLRKQVRKYLPWKYVREYAEDNDGNSNGILQKNDTQDGAQGGTQDKLQERIFIMIKGDSQISTSEMARKVSLENTTQKRYIIRS